jgi:hypothetical protein
LEAVEIIVSGDWGDTRDIDVLEVVKSARESLLDGVSLKDGGPSSIRVVGVPTAPNPVVIKHDDPGGSAIMFLTVIDKRWNQLAYQFGHEFGHILANTWGVNSVPTPPSHWLEEALVEAFSLSGIFRMKDRWLIKPPYANWLSYSDSLKDYAESRLAELRRHHLYQACQENSIGWFAERRIHLNPLVGLGKETWPIIPWLAEEFCSDSSLVADISGLNRWPERGGIPIEEYLSAWEDGCMIAGSSGRLPRSIREKLLGLPASPAPIGEG